MEDLKSKIIISYNHLYSKNSEYNSDDIDMAKNLAKLLSDYLGRSTLVYSKKIKQYFNIIMDVQYKTNAQIWQI